MTSPTETCTSIVPMEIEEEESVGAWVTEPTTLPGMLDKYIVENKMPGRVPGTTLFLVQSKARDGSIEETVEGQTLKLFLVIWLQQISICQGYIKVHCQRCITNKHPGYDLLKS